VKIRANIRTIIKLTVIKEYNLLKNLWWLYTEKIMKKYKLMPSQFKCKVQLHRMREYLETTFANSICVCASRRDIHDNNIKGDKTRYSEISAFDRDNIGAYKG
jgi:hypothetical protein